MPYFPPLPELKSVDLNQPIQNALAMYGGIQQAKMNNMRMRAIEDEMKRGEQSRTALTNYLSAADETGRSEARNALLRSDPRLYMDVQKSQAEQEKTRFDRKMMVQELGQKAAFALLNAPENVRPEYYKQLRQGLINVDPIFSQIPEEFNEAWVRAAVSPEKQMEIGMKPPTVRTFQEGESSVDKQWDPSTRTWVETGRGPKFKPSQPKPEKVWMFHPERKLKRQVKET